MRRAQRLAQSDFARALGHRDQHDVDDANRAQAQRDDSDDAQEPVHGAEDLADFLVVLDRVPVFERVFQFGIESVAARDDFVQLAASPEGVAPA